MKPESRRALSAYVDDELPAAERAKVEAWLHASAEARAYLGQLEMLRGHMRYESVAAGLDVAPAVLGAIEPRPPILVARLAAAFAAGAVLAALVVGFSFREPSAAIAAAIPDRVVEAQADVATLTARLDMVERGFHPAVPERTSTGTVDYRAPESIRIAFTDTTVYPSGAWVANHTEVVVQGNSAWRRGPAACPTEALPDCTPARPRLVVLTGREPFSQEAPAPLDVVVPARAFLRQGDPEVLGVSRLDDREAIGVAVTAAQVAALLDGLTEAGNWRDIHPTDRVELWLDREALTPLALAVYPSNAAERRLWAIRNGYADVPDTAILEVVWSDVVINGPPSPTFAGPDDGDVPSAGFEARPLEQINMPSPSDLPQGMTLHRSGVVVTPTGPVVSVASWSDGRSWLKIRFTDEWAGGSLFGDLGPLVRRVKIGLGVGYVDEQGERVALHATDGDVVVMGSVPTETLLAVAASLNEAGQPVPDDWREAASGTTADAEAEVPGLLLPTGLDGFGEPTITVGDGVATLAYAGQGNRGFRLSEGVGPVLPPPLNADLMAVPLRETEARYSAERGRLEWVEGELVITLTSDTLSREELMAIAESLEKS